MNIEIKKLDIKTDERGWLAEILRDDELDDKKFGQIMVTTAHPGVVKGNHFHKRKVEYYCVMKGDMVVHLEDNETGERKVVEMGEKNPVLLRINPNISHAVKCVGDEMAYLVIYISESYDPDDPDTFLKRVINND